MVIKYTRRDLLDSNKIVGYFYSKEAPNEIGYNEEGNYWFFADNGFRSDKRNLLGLKYEYTYKFKRLPDVEKAVEYLIDKFNTTQKDNADKIIDMDWVISYYNIELVK